MTLYVSTMMTILTCSVDLRNKLRVTMVNAQGLDEPGIDGGGVFREFLNELLKTGFDPNRGYFTTTQDGLLYPNPQVCLLYTSPSPRDATLSRMPSSA